MKTFTILYMFFIMLFLLLVGCEEMVPQKPVTMSALETTVVEVTPTSATILKGQMQQFDASYGYNPNQNFDWAVMGATSEGTNINKTGLLIVAINEQAQLLLVTATLTSNGTKSGNTTLNIANVTSVDISPTNSNVQRGKSLQFRAVVNGNSEIPQSVYWTIMGSNTGTSINSSGLLTIARDETAITLTVTATSTYDDNKSGNAIVNITRVANIEVIPATVTVARGQTQQFNVTMNGYSQLQIVVWDVIGGIQDTSISSSGLLTIASTETATTLVVIASLTNETIKRGYATIILTEE